MLLSSQEKAEEDGKRWKLAYICDSFLSLQVESNLRRKMWQISVWQLVLKSVRFKFKGTSSGKPSIHFYPDFIAHFQQKPHNLFSDLPSVSSQRTLLLLIEAIDEVGMHTLAPVSAWHPWGAKNSRVCSHISNLFVLQVLFFFLLQRRGYKPHHHFLKPKQEAGLREAKDTKWNQTLKIQCVGMFICVRSQDVRARWWERKKCGATVCILQSVFSSTKNKKEHLIGCTSRAKQEHVALTTAHCGQILAGCGWAVVSPDITDQRSCEMNACGRSILDTGGRLLEPAEEGRGGAEQLEICHTWGHTILFTCKICCVPSGEQNSIY